MKSVAITMLAIVMCCSAASAAPTTGQQLGQFGLGVLGSVAGAVAAITVISVGMEQIEARAGRVAVVIGSLTLFNGVGAAAGVLAGGRIWDIDGSVGGSILGGMAGGLASAFVEPLLYTIGIPEGWTEFFGMALIPILPALGAMVGFGL
ncbi:hypothetical protein KAR02_03650 [Candidatus Bipolaricaulota bacterium]|nr:hypothetical protein [Candidatus Bipolaricaulota bacterium]